MTVPMVQLLGMGVGELPDGRIVEVEPIPQGFIPFTRDIRYLQTFLKRQPAYIREILIRDISEHMATLSKLNYILRSWYRVIIEEYRQWEAQRRIYHLRCIFRSQTRDRQHWMDIEGIEQDLAGFIDCSGGCGECSICTKNKRSWQGKIDKYP